MLQEEINSIQNQVSVQKSQTELSAKLAKTAMTTEAHEKKILEDTKKAIGEQMQITDAAVKLH